MRCNLFRCSGSGGRDFIRRSDSVLILSSIFFSGTWNAATKEWTVYVYVTDVVGCKQTKGSRKKSGPFPITIRVEDVSEAPTTVGLTLATSTPMTSLGKLLELQGTTNPSSWELSTQRVVGTFFHSADGDCAAASRTCEYECKNAAGGWVIGSSCGGPSKNTFKIISNRLVLSTSSQDALDYEATSQTLDVTVRVVVVDSSGATTVRVGGAEKDLSIPMANVNEAPVGTLNN